jgi:hypothetical protein
MAAASETAQRCMAPAVYRTDILLNPISILKSMGQFAYMRMRAHVMERKQVLISISFLDLKPLSLN